MLLSLLLSLMLPVCSSQANNYYGTVMTYYPKSIDTSGSVTVVIRYKLNFHSCTDVDTWECNSGDCGNQTSLVLNKVYNDSTGEWCQREGIMTRQVPSNARFQLGLEGGNWISNIVNGIRFWKAVTLVDLRCRSDTGRVNKSPQTTVLPILRVPSNCPRHFNLLVEDLDFDGVTCRYGTTALSECNPCTPPSVLHLSPYYCSLRFSPTNSSNEGLYAVQLMIEDFPLQTITLTQTDGSQTTINSNDPISKIPVQFVFSVDPVVPSCTEGLYLPKFLPPTPDNRAWQYTPVNQAVEISINAQANISTISELLVSGPSNMKQTTTGPGQYNLSWTPSEDEGGETHVICFVVQAVLNTTKYQSELRCVFVLIGNVDPVVPYCTEVLDLPKFLPPTPVDGARLYTAVNQTLEISINAQANISTFSYLRLGISHLWLGLNDNIYQNVNLTTSGLGWHILRWTPSEDEDGLTFSICFYVVAGFNTTYYDTEIRCVIVNVGNDSTSTTTAHPTTSPVATNTAPPTTTPEILVIGLRVRISSSTPLSDEDLRNTVVQQLRLELVRLGILPPSSTLNFVSRVKPEV